MPCPNKFRKMGLCSPISFKEYLKNSIADEATSYGKVSRKSIGSETAKEVCSKKLGVKYNGRSLLHRGDHNNVRNNWLYVTTMTMPIIAVNCLINSSAEGAVALYASMALRGVQRVIAIAVNYLIIPVARRTRAA